MRIGPFVIEQRLGRGGMAEVFAGRHEGQGVDVAVKLLRVHEHSHGDALTQAFRREAERLAALDHPNIVTVLDTGVLPSTLVHGDVRFEAGTPYFVMERATCSLDAIDRTLTWQDALDVATPLLDALAHAHARGFVHRDLKPGNILLHEEPGARSRFQLGDFGIAHTFDDVGGSGTLREGLVGTPGFMAPEQIRGDFRDLGPWTDLYALGVTLHVMMAGRSPFSTETPQQTLLAQLATPQLPPLPSWLDVPSALQEMLFAATQVEPRRRLRRAADAMRMVQALSTRAPSGARTERADIESQATIAQGEPAPTSFARAATVSAPALRTAMAPGPSSPSSTRIEEVPATWRTPVRSTVSRGPRLALVGAGLSLYGVRAIPLAGRRAERDTLWGALVAAVREGRPTLVQLRGSAGVGKTRLMQWLATRAHELGVAEVLVARHGPERGPLDGLRPALARHFGCVDLDELALGERLRAQLGLEDPLDVEAVVRYLAPAARAGVKVSSDAGSDLHALRLLLRAEDRPWIVVIDDVQWADEAAAVLLPLLEDPMAVLFVTTEQLGAPASSARALMAVERARAASGGPVLTLGPLDEDEHLELVQELLRLEPSLARRIALRTAGSPLFAVALVGDWIRRGKLVVGAQGFELARSVDGAAGFDLPDDLHAVWLARADLLLGDDRARNALLELAAMLGVRVALDEWIRCAASVRLAGVPELSEQLLREGLFVREPESPMTVRFVHGLLRESVLRRSREQGQGDELALAVARLLEGDARAGVVGAAERLGRHYVSHPSLADAHPWLLRAAEERRASCEFAGALALLDEASVISPEAEIGPRTAPAVLLRSWTLRLRGELPAALATAEQVLAACDRPELAPFAADARLRRADVDVRVGRVDRACVDLEAARADFAVRGDLRGFGLATWIRAWIDVFRGDLVGPVEALSSLRVALERPGAAPPGATHTLWALAYAQLARGDLEDAASTYVEAEQAATRFRNRLGIAHVRAGQSQLARLRGAEAFARERAHELAAESVTLFHQLGASEAHFGELALALALADLGRFDEGIAVLDAAIEGLERAARSGFAARLGIFCVLLHARAGDEITARARLGPCVALLAESGVRDALLAREALVARASCRETGLVDALGAFAAAQLENEFFRGELPGELRALQS